MCCFALRCGFRVASLTSSRVVPSCFASIYLSYAGFLHFFDRLVSLCLFLLLCVSLCRFVVCVCLDALCVGVVFLCRVELVWFVRVLMVCFVLLASMSGDRF